MPDSLSALVGMVLKIGAIFVLFNEVRGLILTAPVFYAMYQAGGTPMAIWLGFCSLSGIALSVIVPMLLAARIKKLAPARAA